MIDGSGGIKGICRDCLAQFSRADRCPECKSPRTVAHAELHSLSMAHIDCDAFFAAIEKRDRLDLRNKPVIVGGGKRGVVATCCYIARIRGVHSAMPMYEALRRCPEATVLRPDGKKYRAVGHQVRAMMEALTPLVEPVSIDEAFLDLSGTERLHGASPASVLAGFAQAVEERLAISVSIGLSYNKFLAKMASDMDKPRGFSVIGRAEARDVLASRPAGAIWGVGRSLERKLANDGIRTIGDLQSMEKTDLMKRYGAIGDRLYHFSRGEDTRMVKTGAKAKSISSETTFEQDISEREMLEPILWQQCQSVADDLKEKGLQGRTVTLKLKPNIHKSITRSHTPDMPVRYAVDIYEAAERMLAREADGTRFRLIGVGVSGLLPGGAPGSRLNFDPKREKLRTAEDASDRLKRKFGKSILNLGRGMRDR